MVVQFTKHADKPPTLTCIRDDGSVTWFSAGHNGEFFVAHDLLHYAVETTLGYSSAFYGMVAAGRDLNNFGTKGGQSDSRPYSEEALRAEQLVGLIQVLFPTEEPPNYEIFVAGNSVNWHVTPEVTEERLRTIHAEWRHLLGKWNQTSANDTISIVWP